MGNTTFTNYLRLCIKIEKENKSHQKVFHTPQKQQGGNKNKKKPAQWTNKQNRAFIKNVPTLEKRKRFTNQQILDKKETITHDTLCHVESCSTNLSYLNALISAIQDRIGVFFADEIIKVSSTCYEVMVSDVVAYSLVLELTFHQYLRAFTHTMNTRIWVLYWYWLWIIMISVWVCESL